MMRFLDIFLLVFLPLAMPNSEDIYWNQQHSATLCTDSKPLGMISGKIQDWQITSSSTFPREWDNSCQARYARLYQPNGLAWCAKHKSRSEWIQVDLGVAAKVTGVMVQGRGDGKEWVSSFMISYSMNAFHWQYVTDQYGHQRIFEGNSDSYSIKHSYLFSPIIARFIKFHTATWNDHPSMRVEIVGCQGCNEIIGMPPYGKLSASSEKEYHEGSSCTADDGFIFSSKGWCSKRRKDEAPWLQYDVGPPALITGIVTKGRGDKRREWVTRFRVAFSNDSHNWDFYRDASHLEPKEFGGNVDQTLERYHYVNKPFVARFVRFYPIDWNKRIGMRAGLIGCPQRGHEVCDNGFLKVTDGTPCVENVAYHKESWVNNKKESKRQIRSQWTHGQAGHAVDGIYTQQHSCTVLDNFQVDKPVWVVDLGSTRRIAGAVIFTGQSTVGENNYLNNLDKLIVYVGSKNLDKSNGVDMVCGFVSRHNDAVFQPKIHIPCMRSIEGRYVYIEALGNTDNYVRHFSAILCEVMVYE